MDELTIAMLNELPDKQLRKYIRGLDIDERENLAKQENLTALCPKCAKVLATDRSKDVRLAIASRDDLDQFCDKDCVLKMIGGVGKYDDVKEIIAKSDKIDKLCNKECIDSLLADKSLAQKLLANPMLYKVCDKECVERELRVRYEYVAPSLVKNPNLTKVCDEKCIWDLAHKSYMVCTWYIHGDRYKEIRAGIAEREDLSKICSPECINDLAHDPDPTVRRIVAKKKNSENYNQKTLF